MKTVRDKQAKIVQVATTNARTIIYNLINVYQPYPKLITEHKEAIDQALKELEELLKECKPKKLRTTWVSEDPHIQQMIDESCADAIDDYEKNIKEVLK